MNVLQCYSIIVLHAPPRPGPACFPLRNMFHARQSFSPYIPIMSLFTGYKVLLAALK